ncbi:cadherin domain-containing protein, partial [Pseudahrensia aquimaris]|uniref:cadherin domain-containing protein n=1 Tax=Pseudahrensia aquimaris TaxID=744461 RepID=UPI00367096A7
MNDAPVSGADLTVSAAEDAADTDVLATASASDVDAGDTITYSITSDPSGLFEIDGTTGAVSLASGASLDAETATSHTIEVTATDDGTGTLSDTQTITINVTDVDDNATTAPVDGDTQADSVSENAANGTYIGLTVGSTDADVTAGAISYAITGGTGVGLFSVDAATGQVRVAGPIDAETVGSLVTIEVTATPANGAASTASTFIIDIVDVDEFNVSAVTDADTAANEITESATSGTVGVTASATDDDATTNTVSYAITGGAAALFAIDGTTGVVSAVGPFDFEAATSHDIEVTATSADGSTSVETFTIAVTDENDTAPVFTSDAAVDVDENTTAVVTLAATDADTTGETVAFTITGGADQSLFQITGGQLEFIVGAPDFEMPGDAAPADGVYEVTVTASDGTNTTDQTITVTVTDVNEAPTAVALDNSVTTVAENTVIGSGIKVADITIT